MLAAGRKHSNAAKRSLFKYKPISDESILQTQFSTGFVGNYAAFHIARTVATCDGKKDEKSKLLTEIPLDFIPKKKNFTDKELEDRKLFWAALDKRVTEDHGKPTPDLKEDNLKKKILGLRSIVYSLSGSRINRYFAEKIAEAYPDLKLKDGRSIECIKDFAYYVKHAKSGADLREKAFYAMYGMWGTGNEWANVVESEIMDLLMLQYTGLLADGTKKEKVHDGGCFKDRTVKYKNILLEVIKNALMKYHKESILVRNYHKPPEKRNENTEDTTDSEEEFEAPKLVPKSKREPISIDDANGDEDGFFGGYLAKFSGHKDEPLLPAVTPAPKPQAQEAENPYVAWLQAKLLGGEIGGFEDIKRLAETELNGVKRDLFANEVTPRNEGPSSNPSSASETTQESSEDENEESLTTKEDDEDSETGSVLELDEACKCHDYGMFVELFPSHFAPKYMAKKGKYFPRKCANCCKDFVPGKKPADYKGNDCCFVTNKNPVRCCKLATESFSKCVCALCTDCFQIKELGDIEDAANQGDNKKRKDDEVTAGRRSKRSKSGEIICLPGEKVVGGIVVAAI